MSYINENILIIGLVAMLILIVLLTLFYYCCVREKNKDELNQDLLQDETILRNSSQITMKDENIIRDSSEVTQKV
tara:strand:- start:998 stop:1222 length:225 start_codon:yes stop_codon:yes gene_type:complete